MTEPTPPPELPERFIGSYRVTAKLGSGGMGEVLLAHDDRLRRDVAIKRIRAGASMGPEQRERLRREARAAAALSHPAIVQVYDIIEEPDGDSIVMEYVQGRTLFELISEGELKGHAAFEVLLQICDGLEAAHQSGLVHRDLKGENVIVGPEGDAKILDFGVAKSNDPADEDQALTTVGMAIGTYRAMSPEQCDGREIDARSDLFSLGVLMYEMFAGRTPFAGKTPLHTLANVVGFDPPSVRELNGSVPEPLSELIDSLLSKAADGRPATASAVADRLEGMLDPVALGAVVMPRLTATPDSGIDPIGSRARSAHTTRGRRRRTVSVAPPKKNARRAWILGGLGTLAVLAGAAALSWRVMGAGEDPARNRVMVFPLVVSGTDPAQASAGEDVATMIGTVLDGTDPLRWIDGWHLLEGSAREDVRSLTVAQLTDLAASSQCGFLIDGRVLFDTDSVRVILNLRATESGEVVETSRGAVGPDTAPWRAGLRAMNGLLPSLITTEVPDLEASFAAHPADAVAQYLLGEREFRRANVDEALARFQQAFALDSTFALAGMRGAQAASWVHQPEAARHLASAVLTLPLSARSEAYARGILAFVDYDAEEAVAQLGQALAEDSALTVAWAALGEVYRHRAPRDPWPLDQTRPFERALAQDPDQAYLLFHRLEEVIGAGDLEVARTLRRRFLEGDPDLVLRTEIDIMYDCLEGGASSGDWTEPLRAAPWSVAVAAAQFLVGARNLPCAEALDHALLTGDTVGPSTANDDPEGRYWHGFHGLTGAKLAEARVDDARRIILAASEGFEVFQSLMDHATVTDTGLVLAAEDVPWVERRVGPYRGDQESALTRWSELAIAVGRLYPQLSDVAALAAADLRSDAGPDYRGLPYRTSIWMLGLWEAGQGRPDQARQAAARIRELSAGRSDSAYTVQMADALDAHAVLAEGNELEALEAFRLLQTNAPEGTIFSELIGSLPLERLVLAELETSVGDPERALNLVSMFDGPGAVTYVFYLPPGLKTCVRAAEKIGRAARARACQARLSALGWSLEDLP